VPHTTLTLTLFHTLFVKIYLFNVKKQKYKKKIKSFQEKLYIGGTILPNVQRACFKKHHNDTILDAKKEIK